MNKERLIKRLISSIKCSSCGKHYEDDNIDIIERSEELWLLGVLCSSCHVKCLVAAIIKQEKAEAITDLTKAELDKFRCGDAVGVNDVLDMHLFLKDFDGDFPRLWQQG